MSTAVPQASEHNPLGGRGDTFWLKIIYIVSAVVCAAVAFLILGPRPEGMEGRLDVSALPVVNAALNAITMVCLVVGVFFVKTGRIEAHRRMMLSAFTSSALFLVTYVVYHWFKAGPKAYVGDLRTLYLTILVTHIVLAAAILPLALVTLYRGWQGQISLHRKLVRWTFPIWMYVSVTGVVIYGMLYL